MLTQILLLISSLIILVVAAEGLVRGASKLALRLGVSHFVIGVVVIGFGTSAPELAASLASATTGHGELALGNVVGSNIMNIALVLGITALIKPIPIARELVRKETLIVIVVSLLPYLALTSGGTLERWMGALFVIVLACFITWSWRRSRETGGTPEEEELDEVKPKPGIRPVLAEGLMLVAGILMLTLGATLLVESASTLARSMGVSELVIGLTIVAGGTSAPELVTCLVATMRGKTDLGIGNILGSCVFNILGILGITVIVVPLNVPSSMFTLDLPIMIGLAFVCIPLFFTGKGINRYEGAGLLAAWITYTILLYVGWQW